MILQNEYLSDEELNQLILEAEADIFPAPPEFVSKIMEAIQEEIILDKKAKKKSKKIKKQDFIVYCFRVSITVGAAVAFIFIMPYLSEFQPKDVSFIYENALYEEIDTWYSNERKEMRDREYEKLRSYPIKEEVLNDTGLVQKVFGTDGIFYENDDEKSLKENGGN